MAVGGCLDATACAVDHESRERIATAFQFVSGLWTRHAYVHVHDHMPYSMNTVPCLVPAGGCCGTGYASRRGRKIRWEECQDDAQCSVGGNAGRKGCRRTGHNMKNSSQQVMRSKAMRSTSGVRWAVSGKNSSGRSCRNLRHSGSNRSSAPATPKS